MIRLHPQRVQSSIRACWWIRDRHADCNNTAIQEFCHFHLSTFFVCVVTGTCEVCRGNPCKPRLGLLAVRYPTDGRSRGGHRQRVRHTFYTCTPPFSWFDSAYVSMCLIPDMLGNLLCGLGYIFDGGAECCIYPVLVGLEPLAQCFGLNVRFSWRCIP